MSDHAQQANGAGSETSIAPDTRAFTLMLFLRCQAAAIGPMMALMMVPIAGAIAFGVEMGGWYYFQRSAQNAADSAAIAAATNRSTTGSTYLNEARAAARPYGFVNGANNTTVTAAVVTCPAGVASGATCYESNIATVYPLTFSNAIGFTGSDALGSGRGQKISASAVAVAGGGSSKEICVLALSSSGVTFQSNGGPKPDMAGCNIMSNGSMTCNGHDLGASYGIAAGTNNGCGANKVSNAAPVSDPYAARATTIPADPCSNTYPQLPTKNLSTANKISGAQTWTGNKTFCGDVQLQADVTLTGASTTLIIYNGRLDLNGFKLSTPGTSTAAIVFTGTNVNTYYHYPMSSKNKSGTLDIRAPTSGAWSGVALYQDPKLTTNVSFTYAGNEPTWNITGLTYFPKADVTFSGAVNKSATGSSCFTLVAYTILINGTANIFANNTGCKDAGLDNITSTTGGGIVHEKLVR